MTGLIVTGTDTGVGKTVVSAAVCAVVLAAGLDVVYVKPVQSGAADGDDDGADVAALTSAATVTGATLGPSLAPAVAARLGGASLEAAELIATITATSDAGSFRVVEGAGGLLVELGTDGTTVADLAAAADLPLLVTVRPGLGTLNHTALTLEAIASRGLRLAGVVVCGYPEVPDLATRTNLGELDRLSGGRLVGVVPELPVLSRAALAAGAAWFVADIVAGFGGTADRAGWITSR